MVRAARRGCVGLCFRVLVLCSTKPFVFPHEGLCGLGCSGGGASQHRANGERPAVAACVLQGGEGALERGRNSEKEEHLESRQSLFLKSETHDSHTNRQQACVTDLFNSSTRETAGWPSGSRKEARGRRPSFVKGAGVRFPSETASASVVLRGCGATTFGLVWYPSRWTRAAVYSFPTSWSLTSQGLSQNTANDHRDIARWSHAPLVGRR